MRNFVRAMKLEIQEKRISKRVFVSAQVLLMKDPAFCLLLGWETENLGMDLIFLEKDLEGALHELRRNRFSTAKIVLIENISPFLSNCKYIHLKWKPFSYSLSYKLIVMFNFLRLSVNFSTYFPGTQAGFQTHFLKNESEYNGLSVDHSYSCFFFRTVCLVLYRITKLHFKKCSYMFADTLCEQWAWGLS